MTIYKKQNTYDEIALEYYSDLHLTSRNFDTSTESFFKNYIIKFDKKGIFLEIGAGVGKAHELCNINPKKIIYSDLSRLMLEDSIKKDKKTKVQFDAIKIPFQTSIFSGIFAFLYDPYNLPNLYKEICRVLKKGAPFIGTLPHATWGRNLRNIIKIDHSRTIFRKFNSKNEDYITLNSYLSSRREIIKILTQSGFTKIITKDLYLRQPSTKISEHILNVADKLKKSVYDLPIVLLVIGVKV